MRLEAWADVPVSPADLYGVAADLRNLPAWWIEHLDAQVEVPATRSRDAVYTVRYRLPFGWVITALCTVVAARTGRSVTYLWEGGGMRLAVGQSFERRGEGCRTRLMADLAVNRRLGLLGPVVQRLMRRSLSGELDRALTTLGELAVARTVVRRGRPAAAAATGGPPSRAAAR